MAQALALQREIGNASVSRLISAPLSILRALDLHQSGTSGPKGLRDIYKDTVTDKLYSKLGTSTSVAWYLTEVTIGEDSRWKEVSGVKLTYDVAAKDWLQTGAAVPVVAKKGWSLKQITDAGFKKKAANHYQRDEADFLNFHVHVSAYQGGDGTFDSFHVKFDPGVAGHISWFYSWAKDGAYDKPGQSEKTQKDIIRSFANVTNAGPIYGQLIDESERIAGVVRAFF